MLRKENLETIWKPYCSTLLTMLIVLCTTGSADLWAISAQKASAAGIAKLNAPAAKLQGTTSNSVHLILSEAKTAFEIGEWNKTISLYQQVLKTSVSKLPVEDLNNLALAYLRSGDLVKGEAMARQAKEQAEKQISDRSEHSAALATLALAYACQGKAAEARELADAGIEMEKQRIKEKSNQNAKSNSSNSLAALYFALASAEDEAGNLGLAEDAMQQSIAFGQDAYGKTSNHYAIILERAANLAEKMDRKAEAGTLREQVGEIRAKLRQSINNTSAIQTKSETNQSNSKKSLASLKEAIEKAKAISASTTAKGTTTTAGAVDYSEAIAIWKLVLADAERLAKDGSAAAFCLCYLGSMQQANKEYAAAEESFKKAISIREKQGDSAKLALGYSFQRLGGLYMMKQDYPQALACMEKALMLQENNGVKDERMTYLLQSLAGSYMQCKNFGKAESYAKRLLECGRATSNKAKITMASSYLGGIYMQTGRMGEAMALFQNIPQGKDALESNQEIINRSTAEFNEWLKEVESVELSGVFN